MSIINDSSDPGTTTIQRVREAQRKKAAAKYVPTWDEVWYTGYPTANGKRKAGIFQMSLTDTDKARLVEVKAALDAGALTRQEGKTGAITKTEALALYPTLREVRRNAIIEKMLAEKPPNYLLVNTEDSLESVRSWLRHEPITALDTETTGVDVHGTSEIVGISITLPRADVHVYIPVAHVGATQLPREYVFNRLRFYFEDARYKKVLHNAKFDAHMLRKHGVQFRGIHHDTMIAQKILNENEESLALKNLANKYGHLFGYESDSYTFEELFGKDCRFDQVDTMVACVYASKDTHLTWLLYKWQREHYKRLPRLEWLYDNIENPIIDVCITMERTGFLIDMEFAKSYGAQLSAEIEELTDELREHFGGEINLDSPSQLAELFYDKLGLPDFSKKRSVDSKALKAMRSKHAGIEPLLAYREKTKLFGTYVDALPLLVNDDGRIRGSFNQVRAVTGRFSSDSPNLQNLPPEARKLIVSPEGWLLIGSDYSQIEPRVLAHITKDFKLQAIYRNGIDLYSQLAADVFKVPIEECGDGSKYRKSMKIGLLAVMYGISMFSLSESLKITVAEAQQFIKDFYTEYPQVYTWIKSVHEQVKRDEYVETLYGRKRRFPKHREKAIIYDQAAADICEILGVDEVPLNIWADEYKTLLPYNLKRKFQDVKRDVERDRRMAVNAIIQGSAADIMKLALIALHDYCSAKGWYVNGTVHDEVLMQVTHDITLQEVEELEASMIGVVELDIPLKVDTEIFTRWGEGIPKNTFFTTQEAA